MNFGLEDMRNNTILGTPKKELVSLAEKLKKSLKNGADLKRNEQECVK